MGRSLTGFPDGTQATVVTYSSQTRIRYPMGPITGLGARAIGGQRDYYGEIGIDLADGVTHAITELAKVEDARRVLIVVGDGSDTNPDAATRQLRQLAKRAAELQIEVHAIVYKASLSAQDTVVTVLDPNVTTVGTADGITSELVALFERLRKH